jgi:hypothetical protein
MRREERWRVESGEWRVESGEWEFWRFSQLTLTLTLFRGAAVRRIE